MTDEERETAAKAWDSRTPLERFMSLDDQEQSAFLALFAGARGTLQGAWRADLGKQVPVSFGKAECEWPDFDLWRFKLPGLQLTTYEEGPRRVALGMSPGSVVWPIYIGVTDDGREAREAYWGKVAVSASPTPEI
jgi:hypothetical protein